MSEKTLQRHIDAAYAMPEFKFEDVAEYRVVDYVEQGKRTYPSKDKIRVYWAKWLMTSEASSSFECIDEVWLEGDCCFACGRLTKTEKAHILARCEGGSDEVSNFHLLCALCHRQSEFIHGLQYLDWFHKKGFWISDAFKALNALMPEGSSDQNFANLILEHEFKSPVSPVQYA